MECAYAMTTEEEKKMGKKVLFEIEKEADLVRDLTLQAFIEKVGYSLVDQVGPTPFDFKFYVINIPEANAFAIPGGYIFVTTGLLVLAENEQEIAAVLSHEISHVTQRHIAQMIEKSKRLNIASIAAMIGAMLAGRGGAGSAAGAAMAQATAGALQLKFTREMETDADQNGLHLLIKAGYDPNGMINFFNRLQKLSLAMAPNVPPYLLTHPVIENRISLLDNLLQMGPKPSGPFRSVENFNKIRAKAFVEEREPNVAVTHFQSVVDANSDQWEGDYGLGLAYRKMGRFDKSMEVLQRAHSLAPKDLDIARELGITYFSLGKMDQAIESLEAIRSSPGGDRGGDLMALYYLGRGYQEKGDFARALPLLLKVQKERPEFADIYYHLGSLYGRSGQKGLSHFYFGKHFKLRREKSNALLHFRTAVDWLERGSLEREDAQREIKEITSPQ
ncbi:MAG TPA: M48 family metalloprotease [Thermodesulfobacteriota bacterium]|nr:M48 family metalloprotease [Thermodesulfobacteriota bacterium]